MAISALEGLTAAVKGRVVERGDSGYDEARALYNAMIDKHPAAIAYCVDERTSRPRSGSRASAGCGSPCAAAGTTARARRASTTDS